MCGLAGYLGPNKQDNAEIICKKMIKTLQHRGPDDQGMWFDPDAGIALAHSRLSILDLSSAGHQPMVSPCGRYILIYNGEIYNHSDLRIALEKEGAHFNWRGHSDTETLLASLRHWGLDGCLRKINGMFAFAFWDAQEHTLALARDRMGEKPLYYGRSGSSFLFGSELKALTPHPDWQGEIDRDSLALFMRYGYVPTPRSIYKGIFKLPPAHYLIVRDTGKLISQPQCYWNLGSFAENNASRDSTDSNELMDELDTLLRDALNRRMVADVPLGAFLSGGYDSSIVAALMQAQSVQPIKTFSIGFHESAYNEADYAKAVAQHLGTEHTELYVTPEEAMAVIPDLPTIYDEPFADSSQIPTFLVSKLARQHVTVSLSGDGGDELFCGYNRYLLGYKVWSKLRYLPSVIRKGIATACKHVPGRSLDIVQGILPNRLQVSSLADRLPKFAEVLAHENSEAFYRQLISHWKQPEDVVLGASEPDTLLNQPEKLPDISGFRERMMYMDMMTYLPDDILTKVDRASMAVSLEARVPLLDHRLVEFSCRLPIKFKYRNGEGKWLLRKVLYRYIPKQLMERPKMGFGVPIEQWLRGPLRDWAEELLNEKRLKDEGYFNPKPIRNMWLQHCSGRGRWHYYLWDVLMFQLWLEKRSTIAG